MIQSLEKLLDVHFQNPAPTQVHRLPPHRLQSLVCRPPWPITVRTVQEVLFVDRLQEHDDRPLQHFVFKGRDAEGTPVASCPFWNPRPPHGRRSVRAGLGPTFQRRQVLHQVRLVSPTSLSIHARGGVLAGGLVGVTQPRLIHVVGQGREPQLRCLPRQLRYPLLFRVREPKARCPCHVALQRFLDQASPSLHGVPFCFGSPASSVL
jgi:hypothetical protein